MAQQRRSSKACCQASWRRFKVVFFCVCLYAAHWAACSLTPLHGELWKKFHLFPEDVNQEETLAPPLPRPMPSVEQRQAEKVPPAPVPPQTSAASTVLSEEVVAAPTSTQAVSTTTQAPSPTWLFCAAQWQECICQGSIRWGNKNTWLTFSPEAGQKELNVKCSIQVLADVLPGDDGKHCECQATPGTAFFDSINPAFLPTDLVKEKPHQVGSCELFEAGARLGPCGARQWEAVEAFCSPTWQPGTGDAAGARALSPGVLRRLMRAWVEPRFWVNYQKLYNSSGWLARGFVNYFAGAPGGKHAQMTEELIASVHRFSSEPIVVVHYGFFTDAAWTPERFPRLVLLNAPPQPSDAGRSFHFNKIRGFLLARVLTGVELDSDQFVAPGVDTIFDLTEAHVTQDYPLPILPAHFFSFTPKDGNLGGPALWKRFCPHGRCEHQTLRWGHAHPTWTFWAVPFFGRWLRRNLRDETLPSRKDGEMPALRVVDVKEDEDLLNVGMWEEGATKQWCKFDMPDPVEFETLLHAKADVAKCDQGMCGNVVGDEPFNPMGVAKVFFSGHHAVEPKNTQKYVQRLWEKQRDKELAHPILFNYRFYRNGEELRKANPKVKCLI